MSEWDMNKKPPVNVCPKMFCFLWSETDSKCRETFGVCNRCVPNKENKDWYEPCEPELKRHGLPWFYFILNPDKLVDELREEYIRESTKLWNIGKERDKEMCPCCGYYTLPKGYPDNLNNHGFICPVCFWEIDTFISSEEEKSNSNHGLTLAEARINYKTFGAVQKRLMKYCRKPNDNEIPVK